jgi:hypothetical protein
MRRTIACTRETENAPYPAALESDIAAKNDRKQAGNGRAENVQKPSMSTARYVRQPGPPLGEGTYGKVRKYVRFYPTRAQLGEVAARFVVNEAG